MQIAPGPRLGPYEIISAIGAGGMGDEVNHGGKHATMVARHEP